MPSQDKSNGKIPVARERLLEAALNLFVSRGYHGTSTRDIATSAGLSAAAVYVYFPSKQDLLFRLIDFGHKEALEVLKRAASTSSHPRIALRAAVFAFTEWHAKNPGLGRVAQYEFIYLSEENRQVVALKRTEVEQTIRALLEEGARLGVFAFADARMTTLAILALSIDVVRWFPSRTVADSAVVSREYTAIVDRMVGACPADFSVLD